MNKRILNVQRAIRKNRIEDYYTEMLRKEGEKGLRDTLQDLLYITLQMADELTLEYWEKLIMVRPDEEEEEFNA